MTHLWAPGRRCPSPRQGRRRGARPWGEEKGAGREGCSCATSRRRLRGDGQRAPNSRLGTSAARTTEPERDSGAPFAESATVYGALAPCPGQDAHQAYILMGVGER